MSNYVDILAQSYQNSFSREVCVLYTREHGFFSFRTDNKYSTVEFDFERVWELLMLSQFESITMFHTHPPGVASMSSTDHDLVQAWSMALGKPIHFFIYPENIDYLVYNYVERINKKTIVHDTSTLNLVLNKPLRLLQETMMYFSQGEVKPTSKYLEIEKELSLSKSLKNSIRTVTKTLRNEEKPEEEVALKPNSEAFSSYGIISNID